MQLLSSLQSELLKLRRSAILWVCVLGGLFIPLVFLGRFLYVHNYINAWHNPEQGWENLFILVASRFAVFLLPIGIILVCSLIAQVEYKNNNWKQVHTTPQRFTTIFFAKYLTVLLLAALVFALMTVGILLLGIIPCLLFDGRMPVDAIPVGFFLKEFAKIFLSALPILALQYLLSLRFKNFLVSIGIGFVLYVGTMMAMSLAKIYWSPFSHTMYYFQRNQPDIHPYYAFVMALFVVISLVNYFLYLTKKAKG